MNENFVFMLNKKTYDYYVGLKALQFLLLRKQEVQFFKKSEIMLKIEKMYKANFCGPQKVFHKKCNVYYHQSFSEIFSKTW